MRCPKCNRWLARAMSPFGVVYHCPDCGGRMIGLATLRRDRVSDEFRNTLWQASRYATFGGRACPHCNQFMRQVDMPKQYGGLELDVCRHCLCIWFDPSEYQAIPHGPEAPVAARRELPRDMRAREAMAMLDLERGRTEGQRAAGKESGPPAEAWKWLPALFGMPVEVGAPPISTRPLATWGLGAVLVIAFLAAWSSLESAVRNLGFVPDEWSRSAGLTILTSFFVHGGLFHLLGNLYFFLVFGDNVEDRLGKFKFLLLVLASHLAGTLLHAGLDPRGEIPVVGASAGIYGVVAFYAVAFPRARLGLLFFYFWWLRLPAIVLLIFYGGLQLLGAWIQTEGMGQVSSLGHLGGMAVGIVCALAWRARQSRGAKSGA